MGTWKHFYDTGKIFAQGDYLDGLRTGLWIFHYSNGKNKGQGKFRADLKHGMWREWDRDGNLSEVEYIEGVKKAA